ncbi:MAG: hypothetical protein JSU03_02535 [Bacteroidetes bacterium]|nr:hypothetical protein [Bacteroidota bacterium]MBS1756135.1 hypothetical protein [Bacteroidota bacterium]
MNLIHKSIAAVAFLIIGQEVVAQKNISEGLIKYSISIESSKTDAPLANKLNGATFNVYLTPTESRTEMISTLGTETNVYNNNSGKGFILKEYSGQKLMITLNKENWLQKNEWNNNLKFTISNEVKSIAGYECKKATGITSEGKMITVYYAPGITVANKEYNNSFDNLPGLPVQFELKSGNLVFKYQLTDINNDPVAASKFDTPKTGFRIMTYEENQQLKKGN